MPLTHDQRARFMTATPWHLEYIATAGHPVFADLLSATRAILLATWRGAALALVERLDEARLPWPETLQTLRWCGDVLPWFLPLLTTPTETVADVLARLDPPMLQALRDHQAP
jgi:hypothetical protein